MNVLRKVVLEKCTAEDWVVISLFFIAMGIILYFAVRNVAAE